MGKTISWQGYEWLTQERWGQIHPSKSYWWYDSSAIDIVGDELHLRTQYNPKEFTIDGEKITSNIGAGLVSCTEEFGYGYFELEVKLPKGPHLWPAFWMWAFESWPPEIDVLEAYTDRRGSYINWSWEMFKGIFYRVETNVHLGKQPNTYSIGAVKHKYIKRPTKRFNKFAVDWGPDKITIFYNDKEVRTVTNENVLAELRGKTMNVIINNGVTNRHATDKTTMVVKNFKYIKR